MKITGIRINGVDADLALDGKSAYELARDHGFEGTEEEWLASLEGPAGPQGEPGEDFKDYLEEIDAGTTEETTNLITEMVYGRVNADGTFNETTGYVRTDYIDITAVDRVRVLVRAFTAAGSADRSLYCARYDQDKNFIGSATFGLYPLTEDGGINTEAKGADGIPVPSAGIHNINTTEIYQNGMGREISATDYDDGTTYVILNNIKAADVLDWSVEGVSTVTATKHVLPEAMMPPSVLEDIEELKAASESGDTTVLGRNASAAHALNAAARYGYHNGTWNANKRFAALITTDVHKSIARLETAIELLNGADALDCGFCLGDVQSSNFADDATWYTDVVNTATKPFYTLLGNHDCHNYSAGMELTGGTPAESFAKFIQPTLGVMGDETITTPYYKLQFDEHKLVIVCLNNYDAPTDKDADGKFLVRRDVECLSTEQVQWFINTLQAIPSDYHLVIAQHAFPGTNDPIETDDWSQKRGAVSGSTETYTDRNMVPDIINAWKNGTTLSKTYTPASDYATCPTHNINVDFSTRGAGHFVCYLVGHSHRDEIRTSRVYSDQLVVAFVATAADRAQNTLNDLPRVIGERSEDAVTAVTIDTEERKIRLVRFGSDLTFDLKKREHTTLSY